jgi:hypothetical protein
MLHRIPSCTMCLLAVVLLPFSVHSAPVATEGGDATLRLQSEPSGADVIRDGRFLGKTPLDRRNLKSGLYALSVEKEGFAPLKLQVYLPEKGTLDLGNLPLAKKDSVITLWRVGAAPGGAGATDLDAFITASGFRLQVVSMAPKEFADNFRAAFKEAGKKNLPDIIAGNNNLPFRDLQTDETIRPNLVAARGVMQAINSFVFLVRGSPNQAAARQVALANRGMHVRFSWSLEEKGLRDLPGQLPSRAGRKELEESSLRAMGAYILGAMDELGPIRHPDMLGREGAFGPKVQKGAVVGMRPLYILGNSRLAFVLATASFWNEESLGCAEIFSVWVKTKDRWSLLTITQDPISLETAMEGVPKLAADLTEDKGGELVPAKSLAPKDGEFPDPLPGERFGAFAWTASSSREVVGELAEFHYATASRLFYPTRGTVSVGQLWSTQGPWSWRVWSIGKDGRMVLSEARRFRH